MAKAPRTQPFGDGRPRMKDIANWLGVSAATVSLALRDSPRISTDMRARIRAAASELGYVYEIGRASCRERV